MRTNIGVSLRDTELKISDSWGAHLNRSAVTPKLTPKERGSLKASAQYFGMKLKANLGGALKERPVSLRKTLTPRRRSLHCSLESDVKNPSDFAPPPVTPQSVTLLLPDPLPDSLQELSPLTLRIPTPTLSGMHSPQAQPGGKLKQLRCMVGQRMTSLNQDWLQRCEVIGEERQCGVRGECGGETDRCERRLQEERCEITVEVQRGQRGSKHSDPVSSSGLHDPRPPQLPPKQRGASLTRGLSPEGALSCLRPPSECPSLVSKESAEDSESNSEDTAGYIRSVSVPLQTSKQIGDSPNRNPGPREHRAAGGQEEPSHGGVKETAAGGEEEPDLRGAKERAAGVEAEPGHRGAKERATGGEAEQGHRGAKERAAGGNAEPGHRRGKERATRSEMEPGHRGAKERAARGDAEPSHRGAKERAAGGDEEPGHRGAKERAARGDAEPSHRGSKERAAGGDAEPGHRGAKERAAGGEEKPGNRGTKGRAAGREAEPGHRGAKERAAGGDAEPGHRGTKERAARGDAEQGHRGAKDRAVGRKRQETGEVTPLQSRKRQREPPAERDMEELSLGGCKKRRRSEGTAEKSSSSVARGKGRKRGAGLSKDPGETPPSTDVMKGVTENLLGEVEDEGVQSGARHRERNSSLPQRKTENFVRINLKKKSHVKSYALSGNRLRKQMWKQKWNKKGEQFGGGGAKHFNRSEDTCFRCGSSGHWASDCAGKAPALSVQPDPETEEEEVILPTLEDVARLTNTQLRHSTGE
ncbi:LOW QUALITY PROTEIN: uncharacterized protein LOC142473301 [Ascaphus truei]|uniref:LOW QUALITY PROTEIN: uncharacterized protein LOC142473301 n=1 Tax=Ascaphus truei TaxID=8439 RepID=UPI003F59FA99